MRFLRYYNLHVIGISYPHRTSVRTRRTNGVRLPRTLFFRVVRTTLKTRWIVWKLKNHSSIEDLSQKAIDDILNNYNNFSYSYFIKKYNTTEKILINFLKKHNLKKDRVLSFPSEDNWTDEEVEILKNNYEY